jgi:hypothetical protein
MEGQLAMCVNPMASYGGWSGPLWAIEGVRYKFSLRGGPTGYQEGFCEKVDPRCPTVTFRMILFPAVEVSQIVCKLDW